MQIVALTGCAGKHGLLSTARFVGEGGEAMTGDVAEAVPETAERQVMDVVPCLPFEDEPSTFVVVLQELADAHALDDEG